MASSTTRNRGGYRLALWAATLISLGACGCSRSAVLKLQDALTAARTETAIMQEQVEVARAKVVIIGRRCRKLVAVRDELSGIAGELKSAAQVIARELRYLQAQAAAMPECAGALQDIEAEVAMIRTGADRLLPLVEVVAEAAECADVALEVASGLEVAHRSAGLVLEATEAASVSLAGVEDRQSSWSKLIGWLPWVLGGTLALGLSIYFGLGLIVRPLLQRVGIWLTPTQKTVSSVAGKLAGGNLPPREAAAILRSTSPAVDAAYRRSK